MIDGPTWTFLLLFFWVLTLLLIPRLTWWDRFVSHTALERLQALLEIEKHRTSAHKTRSRARSLVRRLERTRGTKTLARLSRQYPKRSGGIALFILFHMWLHVTNPYASINVVQQPYVTYVSDAGTIEYTQHYKPWTWSNPLADLLGYYKQGMLIVENTFLGGKGLPGKSAPAIVDGIHRVRFDPNKPYLISGDQFSVLYPRNLGVFYNRLLAPETAHNQQDWENRQRIYLQSVLYAIDGLADADVPKTTIIPIGPRTVMTTQVHPGDIASDSVYGVLYALDALATPAHHGPYKIQTTKAAQDVLHDKQTELRKIVQDYLRAVRGSDGLVRTDIRLASARDGVSRKSSFYDNVILWKTLVLADKLGILHTSHTELARLQTTIKSTYWQPLVGYYKNDRYDASFSSDWLIGYPTGFFDLRNPTDRGRTEQTLAYIVRHGLDTPLPIKYQNGAAKDAPWVIRTFVPQYGGEAIWSYWGAEYITLLVDVGTPRAITRAKQLIAAYDQAIVRDKGFAETYAPDGTFLRHGLYKSIRVTGWVVQYEWAQWRLAQATAASPSP